MPLVFAGIERPIRGDAVDRQECAVQEQIRLRRRGADRVGQAGGEGGQEVEGLGDVAVRGCGSDAESGRELSIGGALGRRLGECVPPAGGRG